MFKKLLGRTVIFIFVVVAQAVMFATAAYYFYFSVEHTPIMNIFAWEDLTWFIAIVGILLSFTAIYMMKAIIFLAQRETEVELAKTRLKNSKDIVDALRAQKHDVINHLQVIYGLIQLGRNDNAQQYIDQIKGQIGRSQDDRP